MQCGEICGWKYENTGLLGNVNVEAPHLKRSTSTTHGIVLRVDAFCLVRHNDPLFPFDHNFHSAILLLSGAISEPKVHLTSRNLFDIALTLLPLVGFRQTPLLYSIPITTGEMSIHQTPDAWRMHSQITLV